MKLLSLIFLFILISSLYIFPQVIDSTDIQVEETLDELLEESFEEEDNSDLYNSIEELLLNPIDLNSADIFELQKIPGVTLNISETILSYRKRFGPFYSVNELYSIRELDRELINKIIPFLKTDKSSFQTDSTVVEQSFSEQIFIPSKFRLQLRSRYGNDLQTRKGFEDGIYLGSKLRAYNRLILKYTKQIQIGFIFDKDAGEKDFNDFSSFHINVKNIGPISNFIAGDYVLEFGQGLMLWSPYSFSKGADAILPVKRKAKIIKPYTSSTEYDFMRGVASTFNYSDFALTVFYSSKKVDANVDTLTNKITSTPKTGLHLTENDLKKKNRVTENLFGGRISYKYQDYLDVGLSGYNSKFSNEFETSSVYELSGNQFRFYSFDYDLNLSQINFFGEFAYNEKSVASLNGLILSPLSNFIITASIRNYPSNYISLHGFGFGEQSGKTNNEFGIYYGIKWKSNFGLFNLYYDQFRFPYATFENPVSSSGDEIYISFSKKIFNKTNLLLRFKTERKEVSENLNDIKSVVRRTRNSYRSEIVYDVSNKLKLKSRVEYNTYQIKETDRNEKGFLILQDVRFSATKSLLIYGRIILFETDSFNSAVYEFENDLTGVLTNLAMYDNGMRWYLMVRYKPIDIITLSMKYSETYKPNVKTLSSGNNLINNNIDNRISFQIDLNY
ncbi:Hypothetical protein IALB_1696 [Ignavibacterium album JCM 16511]|uniref:Helix-hairpin-helix domain-containing protein n=1 Tax=Ignavibacterium album (strain DSM 19864 / JCM 16511 / NBRC 101810 / Mat9-16) TaxID=945713 RepID=I0AK96_IGNAJ|nr:helix-hairpin-helix domain-containing protein [Ignavibacterium album]AFH49403.1 Hypothetical protein IALB_1696 [Ignavibacterium album JCM 16511]